jgi:hypothetical protein
MFVGQRTPAVSDSLLPDMDSLEALVPLSQGLFPASIAQAFALPSVGGGFSAAPEPLPSLGSNHQRQSSAPSGPAQHQQAPMPHHHAPAGQQGWLEGYGRQGVHQRQEAPQHHQLPQTSQASFGNPRGTTSTSSAAASFGPGPVAPYPIYMSYPQGVPPPYAASMPGETPFTHMHCSHAATRQQHP